MQPRTHVRGYNLPSLRDFHLPEFSDTPEGRSPPRKRCPFTLQFENNSDAQVAGAPHDAFYKSGAGGFSIFIVPSLDLVSYKQGGKDK